MNFEIYGIFFWYLWVFDQEIGDAIRGQDFAVRVIFRDWHLGSGSLGFWIGVKSDSCESQRESKLIFGGELSDAKFLV